MSIKVFVISFVVAWMAVALACIYFSYYAGAGKKDIDINLDDLKGLKELWDKAMENLAKDDTGVNEQDIEPTVDDIGKSSMEGATESFT